MKLDMRDIIKFRKKNVISLLKFSKVYEFGLELFLGKWLNFVLVIFCIFFLYCLYKKYE